MLPGLLLVTALSAAPQAKPAPAPAKPETAKPEPARPGAAKPAPAKVQTLEVRVLDSEGRPVPQATVRVLRPFKAALTDDQGLARFPGLPPGAYRVNAGKAGYKLAEQQATVAEDQPATLEFRLASGG